MSSASRSSVVLVAVDDGTACCGSEVPLTVSSACALVGVEMSRSSGSSFDAADVDVFVGLIGCPGDIEV